jgi:hypothetical protein
VLYHPKTDTWSLAASKADTSSEEGFTLLPDGTVLAPENSNPPYAEKYLISADTWVSAGQTPVSLIESSFSIEIGPCLLRPDGTAFQVGADGHTAVYRSDHDPATPGNWTAAPTSRTARPVRR